MRPPRTSRFMSGGSSPGNPYTDVANKVLAFANDAVATSSKDTDEPFAQLSLAFNKGPEPDLEKCRSSGKERTGAVAVVLSTGLEEAQLIPTTNTDQLYCFNYSHNSTYELLPAPKTAGKSPDDATAFKTVNNDYRMF